MVGFQQRIVACVLTSLSILSFSRGFLVTQLPSQEFVTTCISMSKGDPLREATGIRPSLHPTVINAIADALKARAMKKPDMVFRVSENVKPLDVAMTASKIASDAISKRQESSDQDGMTLTPQEQQTIAGRVVGVIMRLDDLESTLFDKVSNVGWVAKYNEWATFGVVKDVEQTDDKIKDDPLLCMSRAECLLAIFIKTVEIPQIEKAAESVPDGSKIDFLDADRAEVLLGGEEHP